MGFSDQIFFITITDHLNSSNLHGFFWPNFLSLLQTILSLLTYMGFFDQNFYHRYKPSLTLLTYMGFSDQSFYCYDKPS